MPPQGGVTTFDEVVANFKLLMQRGNPALFQAYAVLALASALFSAPQLIITAMSFSSIGTGSLGGLAGLGAAGLCANVFRLAGSMLVATVYCGITRSQRALLLEGPHAVQGGVKQVLTVATQGFGPLLLGVFVSGLAIGVGVIGCGVGIIATAFLFGMAPYLVANGMTDIIAALKRSYELALRNVTPLILCILVMCVGLVVFWTVGAIAALIGGMAGRIGFAIVSLVLTIVAVFVQFVLSQFMSAAHISIEAADIRTPIAR